MASKHITVVATVALTTAAIGSPLRRILTHFGSLDVPNSRSSHDVPVPRCGGLAPLASASTVAILSGSQPSRSASVAVVGLAGLGLADDIIGHVPAPLRLTGQVLAGAALAEPGWGRVVGAVTSAGVVNVTNFMDGINGISGLTAVVWGLNALAVGGAKSVDLPILGALVAGAGAGFLPHNVPAAKLFLGDVGSYSLGGAMAAGILSRRSMADQYRVASPLLLYGLDAAQALLHRARTGQSLGQAHRNHVYQRLVDSGLSHLSVATLHATAAAAVSVASGLPHRYAIVATIAISVVYLGAPHTRRVWVARRQHVARSDIAGTFR